MYRIFVAEDDEDQRRELVLLLENARYETVTPDGFENLTEQIEQAHPDLVLLDIGLPVRSGLEICSFLSHSGCCPVILLTGRCGAMDELNGFVQGADDYIVKPYCAPVVLARIAAVLKRSASGRIPAGCETRLTAGDVSLDLLDGSLSCGKSKEDLTRTELRICRKLFENSGRIVSRDELLDDLWDGRIFIDDNTLSVNITRIRKKLEKLGVSGLLRTRRGQGYQI